MPKDKIKEKALPVGLFILLAMMTLVGGVVWLRTLQTRPAYTFTVAFNNPDRVASGIVAYYRGVQVGRVTHVQLDKDFDSTLVTIGIEEPKLRLAENSEIHVRLEGITGQRYIEIKPPKARVAAFIQPGEIVRGQDNVTFEQLQEQLARIAEERTIEKLLVSAQETMQNMEVMAGAMREFFDDNRLPAQNAIFQFNRTGRAIEVAATDFQGLIGPARDAMPRVTATIEDFGRNTQGLGSAIASIRGAADNIGNTASSFNAQLTDSNLIPETAGTVRSIREGVQDTLGSFRGTNEKLGRTLDSVNQELIPSVRGASAAVESGASGVRQALTGDAEEIRQMRQLAGTLQQSGSSLERRLLTLPAPKVAGVDSASFRADAQRLSELTEAIESGTAALDRDLQAPATQANLNTVQRRLETLKALGEETTEVVDRLRPPLQMELSDELKEFQRRSNQGQMVPPRITAANQMLTNLDDLGRMGSHLSATITRVQPAVAAIEPGRSAGGGGLFGGIAGTLQQARQAITRYDCLAAQTSDMLGERFLGLRLFFGAPGKKIQCDTQASLEKFSWTNQAMDKTK